MQYNIKDVDYFDLPDDRYLGTLPIEKRSDNEYEIEFKNVSFKYPKTDFWHLKMYHLNLKLVNVSQQSE